MTPSITAWPPTMRSLSGVLIALGYEKAGDFGEIARALDANSDALRATDPSAGSELFLLMLVAQTHQFGVISQWQPPRLPVFYRNAC